MSKGDGFTYLKIMQKKSNKFLSNAFKKDPNNVPNPPKGMSYLEIIEEAVRREQE